jgi:hypothetical protein
VFSIQKESHKIPENDMPFAVTYTSGPKGKKSLNKQNHPATHVPLSPRRDLDMKLQRRAAYVDSRKDLQEALVKDYKTTIGSISEHIHFLYQILNEVQRYHAQVHGVRIPDMALEILAEEMANEMSGKKVDHYSECLAKIGRRKVYSSEFISTAIEMVEEHHQPCRLNTCASSQGLSDEDLAEKYSL